MVFNHFDFNRFDYFDFFRKENRFVVQALACQKQPEG